MHVSKKGAFLLLSIVALWAATPALACLMPMPHGSCCRQMEMQGCAAPAMAHCSDCCRMQPTDAPVPPGSASAVSYALVTAPAARLGLILPQNAGRAILPSSEAPPPHGLFGLGSILRI
jgi:hypothetical protein